MQLFCFLLLTLSFSSILQSSLWTRLSTKGHSTCSWPLTPRNVFRPLCSSHFLSSSLRVANQKVGARLAQAFLNWFKIRFRPSFAYVVVFYFFRFLSVCFDLKTKVVLIFPGISSATHKEPESLLLSRSDTLLLPHCCPFNRVSCQSFSIILGPLFFVHSNPISKPSFIHSNKFCRFFEFQTFFLVFFLWRHFCC